MKWINVILSSPANGKCDLLPLGLSFPQLSKSGWLKDTMGMQDLHTLWTQDRMAVLAEWKGAPGNEQPEALPVEPHTAQRITWKVRQLPLHRSFFKMALPGEHWRNTSRSVTEHPVPGPVLRNPHVLMLLILTKPYEVRSTVIAFTTAEETEALGAPVSSLSHTDRELDFRPRQAGSRAHASQQYASLLLQRWSNF